MYRFKKPENYFNTVIHFILQDKFTRSKFEVEKKMHKKKRCIRVLEGERKQFLMMS